MFIINKTVKGVICFSDFSTCVFVLDSLRYDLSVIGEPRCPRDIWHLTHDRKWTLSLLENSCELKSLTTLWTKRGSISCGFHILFLFLFFCEDFFFFSKSSTILLGSSSWFIWTGLALKNDDLSKWEPTQTSSTIVLKKCCCLLYVIDSMKVTSSVTIRSHNFGLDDIYLWQMNT